MSEGLHRATIISLLLLCCLILPAAGAQTGISVLTYHPYPDDADPLGFPFKADRDAFVGRHSFRFDGIPPYPFIVVDGVEQIAGIPNPMDPMESTRAAMEAAYDARSSEPTPLSIRGSAVLDTSADAVHVSVQFESDEDVGQGTIWAALAEDHVAFTPPQAVSNGLTDHRFTVRAITDVGRHAVVGTWTTNVTLTVDPAWDREQMMAVVWLEADSEGSRFDAREILQSISLPLDGTEVAQESRAVLFEMLSATWCDTCLYGDRVMEDLAAEYGLVDEEKVRQERFLDRAPIPWWAAIAALAGGVVAARWRRPE